MLSDAFIWIYKGNKFVTGLHSIISLLALVSLIMTFYQSPITFVSGEEEIEVFSGLWDASPTKFILLAPTIISMFIGQCYAFTVGPVLFRED